MRALLGRRLAWAAAVGLVASVLAAGCAPGTEATGTPVTVASLSGIGPITFATGELDTDNYLHPLLRQWNAAHPKQHVTLIPLPDDGGRPARADGSEPADPQQLYDVMSLDVVWTAEFAANGWIVPLNPELFPLPDFLPPAVATAKYAGRLFAVPFTSNAGLLYYRSDILERRARQPAPHLGSARPPGRDARPQVSHRRLRGPALVLRGPHRELRRGSPVRGRQHPVPGRDHGHARLPAGPHRP